MKKVVFVTALVLMGIYISYRAYRYATKDDGLSEKIKNGAIILDVRTEEEYNRGHIEGSINISLGSIRERYTELDPAQTYITTCSHGLRSVKVETLLKERGFKNVYNGGAWTDLEVIVNAAEHK